MPITLPGNKRINQLAAVIAVGFAVAAVWQEFGSRGEPGENEFADAAMQQIKDQGAFTKEVCGLYAKAAVKGSREGALLLTQCVNQSYTGTASDRRILLAALYQMAGDAEVNGVRAAKQLENLRLTETEKAALAHFDIKAVLDGTVFVSPINMGRLER